MLRNTSENYGSLSKTLHWFSFLIIVALLVMGFLAGLFSPLWQSLIIHLHKLLGLLALFLIIIRLIWVSCNIKPKPITHIPRWERVAERIVQGLIYICLLLMPISGWFMATAAGSPPSEGKYLFPMPDVAFKPSLAGWAWHIHAIVAWTLLGLVIIHILAGLKHHFLQRDNVLKRMLPGV